jgi:four helix bundle protein
MQDLKIRTQRFAIECWKFSAQIPNSREFDAWVRQLIRSSSAIGANYRASQRAKSTADFINKLKIVEEESDECLYWLELFQEVLDPGKAEIKALLHEGNEILAIVVTSIKTARKNRLNINFLTS